jgi:hypothetical protein
MFPPNWRSALPGAFAIFFVTLTTAFWIFWGTAEMFYEGWWGPWYQRPVYLAPGGICLLLTVLGVALPRAGGWLLIAAGAAFTTWWWMLQARRGATLVGYLTMFPVSALLVVTGILFLRYATLRRRRRESGWTPPAQWWKRNFRWVFSLGVPLVVMLTTAAGQLPFILTRVDDGNRGARLIEGNGVRLVWAPAGPGWAVGIDLQYGNFRALRPGEAPSWDEIANYGKSPAGYGKHSALAHASAADMATTDLCKFLSADGSTLLPQAQNIWRMPAADEIVRSLTYRGKNAGCTWDRATLRANCAHWTNKETPLWDPDHAPIYYWAADEYNPEKAYYVSWTGWIGYQQKNWGNARHGFRCVRAP